MWHRDNWIHRCVTGFPNRHRDCDYDHGLRRLYLAERNRIHMLLPCRWLQKRRGRLLQVYDEGYRAWVTWNWFYTCWSSVFNLGFRLTFPVFFRVLHL